MNVNFYVELEESTEEAQKSIEIDVKKGVCGGSNTVCGESMVNEQWNRKSKKKVTLYTSQCAIHTDNDGKSCSTYLDTLYDIPAYAGTVAHEFGHVFGLYDAYPDASDNGELEPIPNSEIKFDNKKDKGIPSEYGMMWHGGSAVANDIEMILYAFNFDSMQYFVPKEYQNEISSAIRYNIQYQNDKGMKFEWDKIKQEMIPLNGE